MKFSTLKSKFKELNFNTKPQLIIDLLEHECFNNVSYWCLHGAPQQKLISLIHFINTHFESRTKLHQEKTPLTKPPRDKSPPFVSYRNPTIYLI